MKNVTTIRKTLLVENNTEIQNLLSLNLKTWVGADIILQDSAQGALNALSKNSDIDLIITTVRKDRERDTEIIYNYLNDHQRVIPIIVLGKSTLENVENIYHLASKIDVKPIIQTAAKLLNVTAKDMANLEVDHFFGVPLKFFNKLDYSNADLFFYDEDKQRFEFLKSENSSFGEDFFNILIEDGIEKLFVRSQDRLKFVANATQEIITKIQLSSLDENEHLQALESTNNLLHHKLAKFGITEETVALSQMHLKNIAKVSKKYSKLSALISRLKSNKNSYRFKNIQLLTYIGNHVIKNIDWGNEEQVEKFSFISFFHDIILETDEQAKIRSTQELKKSNLSQREIDLVNNHALKAAELISKYPKAPMGVDIIIRQHHGITHGVGFSETYGGNLSPMAIVFILAEEFVFEIIEQGIDFDIHSKISQMREKYTTQRFKKIIDLFESITI